MPEVTDPVCGMVFDEQTAQELGAIRLRHADRTFWFCCPACEAEFRADPVRHGG